MPTTYRSNPFKKILKKYETPFLQFAPCYLKALISGWHKSAHAHSLTGVQKLISPICKTVVNKIWPSTYNPPFLALYITFVAHIRIRYCRTRAHLLPKRRRAVAQSFGCKL